MNHTERQKLLNRVNFLTESLCNVLDRRILLSNEEVLIRKEILDLNTKLGEDQI